MNAPQPPPPSPALVRHGSKQHDRRQTSGANRDPRRQSSGQHLSQPSTPGTSANQLPTQGQIRMSQTPLQQNQTAANQPIRASPDRKKKGFMASLLSCCGGCMFPIPPSSRFYVHLTDFLVESGIPHM